MTAISLTLPDTTFLGKTIAAQELVLDTDEKVSLTGLDVNTVTDIFLVYTNEYKEGQTIGHWSGLTLGDIKNLKLKDIGVE